MNGVQERVPRKPSGNDSAVALRLPDEWLKRADALVEFLLESRPGMSVTRSDVLRIALARGLDALEAERDGNRQSPKKGPKR